MKNGTISAIILLLLLVASNTANINYPIRFGYSNVITSWWPPSSIAESWSTPTVGPEKLYNYVALTFWSYGGPLDMAMLWANAATYMGTTYGSTTAAIQKNIRKKFNDNGSKILVSAFGAT